MKTRTATLTLIVSVCVLIAVAAVWRIDAGRAPRADLVGGATTSSIGREAATTTSTPPTTSAPTPSPSPGASPTREEFRATPAPEPVRLRIPAIGVDAVIRPVGLEADGSMEIPGATETGWFSPGTRPGSPFGSAVIAAHIDYAGRPGAFFRLRELPMGAEVTVVRSDGSQLRYRVSDRSQVAKADLPTGELFRTTGAPVLTLITCGGAFDRNTHHYADNIVIQAVPA